MSVVLYMFWNISEHVVVNAIAVKDVKHHVENMLAGYGNWRRSLAQSRKYNPKVFGDYGN